MHADRSPALPGAEPLAILDIDLSAIAANWRMLAARHARGAVAGVVKANAYGLGAVRVAPALHAAGCQHFFVAHLDEALAIRALVGEAMVAVLNGPVPGEEAVYHAENILPVLGSLGAVERWAALAHQVGARLPALLHIDTGMARLGLDGAELAALQAAPERLSAIDVRFVMTHLVSAELPDEPVSALQAARFQAACEGLPPAPRSLANSSGVFLGANFESDLARPGAALYGINPTPAAENPMRPVVRLRARVLQVRDVTPGESVGYNATWHARRPSRIATVGVGYADGWLRSHSGRGHACFDGAAVPLVGRVSMDLATYDVTDQPGVGPGDWLELIGPTLPVDLVAAHAGTNGYEILTSLGRRTHRVYAP